MNLKSDFTRGLLQLLRELVAITCIAALVTAGVMSASAVVPAPQDQAAAKLPADQLDSLVAPSRCIPIPCLARYS